MTLLGRNSTIPDRQRGCIFAELFRDSASVTLNNGVLYGSPTVDNGIVLNGTTQYVRYEQYLGVPELSISMEFTPTFAYNDNLNHTFIDADSSGVGTNRTLLYKRDNNDFYAYSGNLTSTLIISAAVYGPYWLTGQRNVLTWTAKSGANYLYLNGNQIGTSATAWSVQKPNRLYVGATYDAAILFAGTIHSVKVYNKILTKAEHDAQWNQVDYNTRSNLGFYSSIWDRSKGCIFATGTSVAFNGSSTYFRYDQYMNMPKFSVSIDFTPTFNYNDGEYRFFFDTDNSGGGRTFLYKNNSNYLIVAAGATTTILSIAPAIYGPYWLIGQRNVLTITANSTGSNILYLNGYQIGPSGSTWTPQKPTTLYVGTYNGAITYFFAGTIRYVKFYNTILAKADHDAQLAWGV